MPTIEFVGKRDVHYFTVRGRGEFPLDMLRFDSCWPATRLGRVQRGGPTIGRWSSFNWTVMTDEDD